MNHDAVPVQEANARLWTLEEIGQLVSRRGSPSETLANIVELIQRRFPPTSAPCTCWSPTARPGAGRHDWPASGQRRACAHAPHRGARRPGGATGDSRRSWRTRRRIPASSTSARRAKIPIAPSSACRSSITGCSRASWSCRRSAARFDERRCADAGDGRRTAGPDRERSADAGPVRGAGASAARRARPEPVVELGQRIDERSSGKSTRCCGASATTTRSCCCGRCRPPQLEARVSQLALHSRINYAYRRLQEYLQSTQTWGAAPRRRALGAAGRLLLRRVRPARIDSHLLGRPRHPGRRPHQERVGPRHPARRHRAVLRPGLFPPAAGYDGWQQEEYLNLGAPPAADGAGACPDGVPVTSASKRARGRSQRACGRSRSGATRCCCSTRTSKGIAPEDRELTSRLYGGDSRVRVRQELLLGVGGVRALAALGISPGVAHLNEGHSAFAALELTAAADGGRRHRRHRGDPSRGAAGGVHHAHARAGRSRPLPCVAGRGAPRSAARRARAVDFNDLHGPRPRRSAGSATSEFCMTVLALKSEPARQRRVVAPRPGVPGDVERPLSGPQRRHGADRPHHQRRARAAHGWRPQMRQVYDRHLGADWPTRSGKPGLLGRDRTLSTTANCGKRTRRSRRAAHRDCTPSGGALGRAARRVSRRDRREHPPRAQLRRAHHRIRAPVRHLQAGRR